MIDPASHPALKTALRREARERRAALPGDVRAAGAQAAAGLAAPWIIERSPACVALYLPVKSEMDTLPLAEKLAAAGIALALPVVVAEGRPLAFRAWRPGAPVLPGYKGIPEPVVSAEPALPDLLVAPLSAFDGRGHRIGSGAGFYDRTIERLGAVHPIPVLGLAFATQEVREVPDEAHDRALSAIATEAELIRIAV